MARPSNLWSDAAKRALAAANRLLFLERDRLVIAVLLFFIYLALVWIVGGQEVLAGEFQLQVAASVAPLLIYPVCFAWQFFAQVDGVYREVVALAERRRERLTPTVRMSFEPHGGVSLVRKGVVHTSVNGQTSVTQRWPQTAVRIMCRNDSAVRATGCRGQISRVHEIDDSGELKDVGFHEPIDLNWGREISRGAQEVDIEPGTTKALYVLVRRSEPQLGFYVDPADIPLEYVMLLQPLKRYRFSVVLSVYSFGAETFIFDAWAEHRQAVPPPVMIEVQQISPQAE